MSTEYDEAEPMHDEVNPLKPIRKHFKSNAEITANYPNLLRRKQTTLDNHQKIRKMDEFSEGE